MDWPAYSPDLYPIEHVWYLLGRRIAARQPPPTCLPELQRALLDEWCNIPQDQIDNLILSMPRRCVAREVNFNVLYLAIKSKRKENGGWARKGFFRRPRPTWAVEPLRKEGYSGPCSINIKGLSYNIHTFADLFRILSTVSDCNGSIRETPTNSLGENLFH
ncbi:transposable element Tcb1 transposase [Trichonephila clavipes]|nr:transposable element Tcb1 transposase [Trichonephila clavipes]